MYLNVTLTGKVLRWKEVHQGSWEGGSPRSAQCTLKAMWKSIARKASKGGSCWAASNPVRLTTKAINTRQNIRQDCGGTQFQHGPWGTAFDTEANKRPLDNWPDDQSIHSAVHMWSGPAMTPQYVLHTLMHCTYYTVSLTCTVYCTYYILYTVHTVHVPCFPVSVVRQMLRFHLQHLFRPGQTSLLVHLS